MTPALEILLVDDDPDFGAALADSFLIAGLAVELVTDGQAALQRLGPQHGAVVTDLRMPRMDGLQLLAALRARDPELPVLLMTGHGDVPTAVRALQDGAFDFLSKPFATDHLVAACRRALETRALYNENRRLRALAEGMSSRSLLGEAPAMVRLRDTARQLAAVEVDILIEGETGTGKKTLARHLHRMGARRNRPFVAIDCAALPAAVAEETLFGSRSQRGRIAEADRGVLYLSEIDSLPLPLQGRLLPLVESGELFETGHGPARSFDVRLIASSRGALSEAVAEGRFRADLYYRLETVRLRLPPLRERRADVELLFAVFLQEAAEHHGRPLPALDAETAARLASDDWPGNVRELENFATRLVLGLGESTEDSALSLAEQLDRFEAGVLRRQLARAEGDVMVVAEALGLPRRSLYARLQRHGIEPARYRRHNRLAYRKGADHRDDGATHRQAAQAGLWQVLREDQA